MVFKHNVKMLHIRDELLLNAASRAEEVICLFKSHCQSADLVPGPFRYQEWREFDADPAQTLRSSQDNVATGGDRSRALSGPQKHGKEGLTKC